MVALAGFVTYQNYETLAAKARLLVGRGWRLQTVLPALGRRAAAMCTTATVTATHVNALASADILAAPRHDGSMPQIRANDNW